MQRKIEVPKKPEPKQVPVSQQKPLQPQNEMDRLMSLFKSL